MSCKLYLVPEDIIRSWKGDIRSQQNNAPQQSTINKIDENMQRILNDDQLDDYDKEKLYTQNLGNYVNMRDKQNVTDSINESQQSIKQWSNDTLSTIPKTMQTKAKALMKYMQMDQDISWDTKGQLVLKGQVIPKSNVIDLLHDSVRPRKTSKKPKGWKELRRHFQSRNIAQELLGNSEWKNISSDENTDQQTQDSNQQSDIWTTPPHSPERRRLRRPSRTQDRFNKFFTLPNTKRNNRWIHLQNEDV